MIAGAGRVTGRGILCAIALNLGCAALQPAPPSPYQIVRSEPGEPSIVGQVRSVWTGAGFADAVVLLFGPEPDVMREVHTDAGGLYRFHGLRPGKYEVRVFTFHNDLGQPIDLPADRTFRVDFVITPYRM